MTHRAIFRLLSSIIVLSFGGLLLLPSKPAHQVLGGEIRIREDIDTVYNDPAKLAALKLAFETLEDPPDGQRSLRDWANIHGNPSRVQCEHNSEMIWPWHRAYLYKFETALRESHPPETNNVTLPYWNWTAPPTGRRYPKAYEEQGALFDETRITAEWPRAPLPASTERQLIRSPSWRYFGGGVKDSSRQGGLESQLHNTIHDPFVDGNMRLPATSARDPIFWAHHANLDRIWSEWQAAHGHTEFGEPNRRLRAIPGNPTAGEWLDIRDKYAYGPKANPVEAGDVMIALPSQFEEVPVYGADQALSYEFEAPADAENLILRLEQVSSPQDRSFLARVYLHPSDEKYQKGNDRIRQDFLLTYFTAWEFGHGGHTGHESKDEDSGKVHSNNYILDVTDRAKAIIKDSNEKPLILTIDFTGFKEDGSLEPLPAGEGEGPAIKKLFIEFTVTREIELKSRPPQ